MSRVRTDDRPDLVVIQVYITSARRAYALADHYRARGAFVALGGLHVTSLPEEAARARGRDLSRPWRADVSEVSRRLRARRARRVDTSRPRTARSSASRRSAAI